MIDWLRARLDTIAIVLWGVAYVVLAVAGDVGLKLWGDKKIPEPALLGAMAIHAMASAAWAMSMRAGAGYGRSAVILMLANLAGAVATSYLVFGERLGARHFVGIAAAVVVLGAAKPDTFTIFAGDAAILIAVRSRSIEPIRESRGAWRIIIEGRLLSNVPRTEGISILVLDAGRAFFGNGLTTDLFKVDTLTSEARIEFFAGAVSFLRQDVPNSDEPPYASPMSQPILHSGAFFEANDESATHFNGDALIAAAARNVTGKQAPLEVCEALEQGGRFNAAKDRVVIESGRLVTKRAVDQRLVKEPPRTLWTSVVPLAIEAFREAAQLRTGSVRANVSTREWPDGKRDGAITFFLDTIAAEDLRARGVAIVGVCNKVRAAFAPGITEVHCEGEAARAASPSPEEQKINDPVQILHLLAQVGHGLLQRSPDEPPPAVQIWAQHEALEQLAARLSGQDAVALRPIVDAFLALLRAAMDRPASEQTAFASGPVLDELVAAEGASPAELVALLLKKELDGARDAFQRLKAGPLGITFTGVLGDTPRVAEVEIRVPGRLDIGGVQIPYPAGARLRPVDAHIEQSPDGVFTFHGNVEVWAIHADAPLLVPAPARFVAELETSR